jgi:cell division control protein 6
MSSKLVRDARPLSFDYVPEKIPHREGLLSSAKALIEPVLEQGYTSCVFTGPVGTGKTLVALKLEEHVKALACDARSDLRVIHVNCRISSTEGMVLTQVLKAFDSFFRERGTSFDEKVMHLASAIEAKKARILLVLDEFGHASTALERLVYVLLRFHEYTRRENPISLILISSKPVFELFDDSIRSIFKKNILTFDQYSEQELFDILKSRAPLALVPNAIDDETLGLIAESAERSGDARRAIEILELSARAAESDGSSQIMAEHVRSACASIEPSMERSDFDRMPKHELLVMLGLARELRKKVETTTGAGRLAYAVACEERGLRPVGQTQYWKYVKKLEALGLISTRGSSGPRRGKTTLIALRDIPATQLIVLLTTLLRGRTGDGPEG